MRADEGALRFRGRNSKSVIEPPTHLIAGDFVVTDAIMIVMYQMRDKIMPDGVR